MMMVNRCTEIQGVLNVGKMSTACCNGRMVKIPIYVQAYKIYSKTILNTARSIDSINQEHIFRINNRKKTGTPSEKKRFFRTLVYHRHSRTKIEIVQYRHT